LAAEASLPRPIAGFTEAYFKPPTSKGAKERERDKGAPK